MVVVVIKNKNVPRTGYFYEQLGSLRFSSNFKDVFPQLATLVGVSHNTEQPNLFSLSRSLGEKTIELCSVRPTAQVASTVKDMANRYPFLRSFSETTGGQLSMWRPVTDEVVGWWASLHRIQDYPGLYGLNSEEAEELTQQYSRYAQKPAVAQPVQQQLILLQELPDVIEASELNTASRHAA